MPELAAEPRRFHLSLRAGQRLMRKLDSWATEAGRSRADVARFILMRSTRSDLPAAWFESVSQERQALERAGEAAL